MDDNREVTNEEVITSDDGCMLTTVDNPFNPFDDFDSWLMFDIEKGYNTCGMLARVAAIPDGLSQKEIDRLTESAIDKIIENDFLDLYKKVTNHAVTA